MSKIPEFRAWYDNKMWCLAKLDLWGDPDQAICDLAPYLPKYEELYDIYLSDVILMQSTGLKDEHGVEIFEGDIVEYELFGREKRMTIEYDQESASFRYCIADEIKFTFDSGNNERMSVIGDIYQNPELLEEAK